MQTPMFLLNQLTCIVALKRWHLFAFCNYPCQNVSKKGSSCSADFLTNNEEKAHKTPGCLFPFPRGYTSDLGTKDLNELTCTETRSMHTHACSHPFFHFMAKFNEVCKVCLCLTRASTHLQYCHKVIFFNCGLVLAQCIVLVQCI